MMIHWKLIPLLLLGLIATGCGKQSDTSTEPAKKPGGPGTQSGGATATGACPLFFASEGLCAQIVWTAGPSADGDSSFDVSFWKKDTGTSTGPFTEPSSQVGSYIRMTCCGSISFPKVNKIADGKYGVTKVRFVPGEWEVYVQLKNGAAIEKQFVPVKLND